MSAEKFSVSTTSELFDALEALRERREEDRSSLIEILLREHPVVRREIRRQRRTETGPATKRGRDDEEVRGLARSARRQWEKREARGEVEFLDR